MSTTRIQMLAEALEWALQYIDAIPAETAAALPAMPGFDRDYVDELLSVTKRDLNTKPIPKLELGAVAASPSADDVEAAVSELIGSPMPREAEGQSVGLSAKITYPGSRVSDVLIGKTRVQLPNEDLKAATFVIFSGPGGEFRL